MIFVMLRMVIVALALWLLWRVCTVLFSARRSPSTRTQHDEWGEVLEAIDELPETTETQLRVQEPYQPLQPQPCDNAASTTPIETVIVREAEAALSRIQEGDANERLAAYYEITTYAKLCSMTDCHISEATWKTINDMHRQAREIIGPPERN